MAESFLRIQAVQTRTGLSRSTIYERIKEGAFPRPVSLGLRAIGFVESEISEWIDKRISDSRGGSS